MSALTSNIANVPYMTFLVTISTTINTPKPRIAFMVSEMPAIYNLRWICKTPYNESAIDSKILKATKIIIKPVLVALYPFNTQNTTAETATISDATKRTAT